MNYVSYIYYEYLVHIIIIMLKIEIFIQIIYYLKIILTQDGAC